MIRLGKRNQMTVVREVEFGLYLDGGEVGEVLLPSRYVTPQMSTGSTVDVFLYLDSEERLTATTEQSLVEVNQFACLQVKWTNEYGAFLDWGLMKDLFCPFHEQKSKMQQGQLHVVYCYIDPISYRIVASAKIGKFLSKDHPDYCVGHAVEALIIGHTDRGLKAIVDGKYMGLIFQNEIFQSVHVGDHVTAYVKKVREDGKIDLKLQHFFGRKHVEGFSEQLLNYLRNQPTGFCPLHDKSDAEDIYLVFGVSKKTFKRAVGDLYKQHLITLADNGIQLRNLQQLEEE